MNENVYSMDGITNASNSWWLHYSSRQKSRRPRFHPPQVFFYPPILIFSHAKPFSAISNSQNHFQQYLTTQENILQKVIHGRSEIVSRNAASWGAAPRQNQKEKGQSLFLAKAAPNPQQPTDMASLYLSFCQASPPYPCQQKDRRESSAKRWKVCLLCALL